MNLYEFFVLIAFLICTGSLLYKILKLVKAGVPKDYSRRSGDLKSAIIYSFFGAMSPSKKESAYLHLPTYTAGVLYHIGTFIAIVFFFLFLLDINIVVELRWITIILFVISSLSGLGILIKRIIVKNLRSISNLDDYISNILVTGFQVLTLLMVVNKSVYNFYLLWVSLLLLYLPFGKLKHSFYFFIARYFLGVFYGWRGVWPLSKLN